MSSRIEKQFTNAATTPILITMSFELNDDKIIERIDAAGGTVPQNDVAKAEQQRMVREMVYEYARLFRIIHGTDRLKVHMQAFGVTTMRDLPPEVYIDFMRDCRTYAEKCMP